MKWHPYGLGHLPATLPDWQTLITDLGVPPARVLAQALGLSERTVQRYHQLGRAPRVACLALFWMTRWGRSQVNTQAVNDASLAAGYANALEHELDRTRAELARVLRLNHSVQPSSCRANCS